MERHDAIFAIEQCCLRYGCSPTGAIPGIDLESHAEAVEVNLIPSRHNEIVRYFGSPVIVAGTTAQHGQTAAQEKSQRDKLSRGLDRWRMKVFHNFRHRVYIQ